MAQVLGDGGGESFLQVLRAKVRETDGWAGNFLRGCTQAILSVGPS